MSDDEIHNLISAHVTLVIRVAIPELFGSLKTTLIELFDERYAATTIVVVAAEPHGEDRCSIESSVT